MGSRLGEQDGYPAGVSNRDFAGAEDPDCMCGHTADEHDWEGSCDVDGCPCSMYESDDEGI